jgi:hypothetical protein
VSAADFPDYGEAFEFVDAARLRIEGELNCTILHDREITEEAIMEAEKGFNSIRGVPFPNQFKVAGQVAFWLRKLKPFRIFRCSTFIRYLDEHGVAHGVPRALAEREVTGNPLHPFVNEMIAAQAAFGIVRAGGTVLKPKAELVHDLIFSLRYHSFSPNAVRIILEGMAQ